MEQDHIDRFLAELVPIEGLDLEVEGIVDRIYGIQRRFHRSLEAVLAEHGLTVQEWQVLSKLRNKGAPCASSPGELADHLDLSSGAMTNRLDRMERSGLIVRKPDPDDRRGVVVELTEDGRHAYESATGMQARREAFFASALSRPEQEQLNGLLRKLMLALERLEAQPGGVAAAGAAANGAAANGTAAPADAVPAKRAVSAKRTARSAVPSNGG